MNLEEVKKQFKERDRAIRVLSKNGLFRATAISNKNTNLAAQTKHNLPVMPAYVLSNVITAATLISSFLKGEERVIVDVSSDGYLKKIYAEVMHLGECRGYINYNVEKEKINKYLDCGLC